MWRWKAHSFSKSRTVADQALAIRRVIVRICATHAQATALAMAASKSLVRRRQRPSQANVLSTTHRRGRISKTFPMSERLMISNVHDPLPSALRAVCSRHSRRRRRCGVTTGRANGSKPRDQPSRAIKTSAPLLARCLTRRSNLRRQRLSTS